MRNYDKQLAKYARQLDNPKYYSKILDILTKAEKKKYKFKMFNTMDLLYMTKTIYQYYDLVKTDEKNREMIDFCNNWWFIKVNDEIIYETKEKYKSLLVFTKIFFLGFMAFVYYKNKNVTIKMQKGIFDN